MTFWNKHVDEEKESSREQSSHFTKSSTNFVHEEIHTSLHWYFNECKDKLCEVQVKSKPRDIKTYPIICKFGSKPKEGNKA